MESGAICSDVQAEGFPLWSGFVFRGAPPKRWNRCEEGRGTLWSAFAQLLDGKWTATVERRTVRGRLRSPLRVSTQPPDGCWTFGPFSSHLNAIRFTEIWLTTRRDPETWRAKERVIPLGDWYSIHVQDEALLLAAFPAKFAGAFVQ